MLLNFYQGHQPSPTIFQCFAFSSVKWRQWTQDNDLFLGKSSGKRQSHMRVMFLLSSSWIIKHQQSPARRAQTFWKGAVPTPISAGVNIGGTLLVFLYSFSWTIEIRCLIGKFEAEMWDSCCHTNSRGWNSSFPDTSSLEFFVCFFKERVSFHTQASCGSRNSRKCSLRCCFSRLQAILKVFWFNRYWLTGRTWKFRQVGLIWRGTCRGSKHF